MLESLISKSGSDVAVISEQNQLQEAEEIVLGPGVCEASFLATFSSFLGDHGPAEGGCSWWGSCGSRGRTLPPGPEHHKGEVRRRGTKGRREGRGRGGRLQRGLEGGGDEEDMEGKGGREEGEEEG